MFEVFKTAQKDKGLSTLLYDDPDVVEDKDVDLIMALTDKLQTEPDYPLPEGYLKTKERIADYDYVLPEKSKHLLKESMVISVETLDGLVNSLFGFHFIEPSITYIEKIKAKK